MAQGDRARALALYRKNLQIAEALAACDPASSQRQIDVVVSYAKLGNLDYDGVTPDEKRRFWLRGHQILLKLKAEGRLPPNQDWTALIEQVLSKLPADQ